MTSPRALDINGKGIVLKEIVLNPHQVEMLGIAPKQNLTEDFFFFFEISNSNFKFGTQLVYLWLWL